MPKIDIWTTESITISHGKVQNIYPKGPFLSTIRDPQMKQYVYSQFFFIYRMVKEIFFSCFFNTQVFNSESTSCSTEPDKTEENTLPALSKEF